MNYINSVLQNLKTSYSDPSITSSVLLSVLLVTLVMSIYEFAVYRIISKRALYNRSFNITIAIMPFFVATIILCLQSNLVITLGTIGALAIIRFRTPVKDPVDMIYLLWSIHTGITCGCQLYKVSFFTSLLVTVLLLALDLIHFGGKPSILIFDCMPDKEEALLAFLRSEEKRSEIKSRSFNGELMHYTVELSSKNTEHLSAGLREAGAIKFSLISYDADNIE